MIEFFAATLITLFARFVTGVRGEWVGCPPEPASRVYFANHVSHGDFVLLWTVLPAAMRRVTRPVAGADYWLRGKFRRFIGEKVFRAVLIDRTAQKREDGKREDGTREVDPVGLMVAALDEGASLIFFPEGTRNTTEARLLQFRSGLYRIAMARPHVELVPVWIENLNRVMPKGEIIPIPLLCTVTFGGPVRPVEGEDMPAFLTRARASLLALAPLKDDTA